MSYYCHSVLDVCSAVLPVCMLDGQRFIQVCVGAGQAESRAWAWYHDWHFAVEVRDVKVLHHHHRRSWTSRLHQEHDHRHFAGAVYVRAKPHLMGYDSNWVNWNMHLIDIRLLSGFAVTPPVRTRNKTLHLSNIYHGKMEPRQSVRKFMSSLANYSIYGRISLMAYFLVKTH